MKMATTCLCGWWLGSALGQFLVPREGMPVSVYGCLALELLFALMRWELR